MKTLIITEKPKVAERIARSIGNPEKLHKDSVPYYRLGNVFVAPAVGHIYGLKEKNSEGWKYPVFDIEWIPNYEIDKGADFTKKYLNTIKSLAKDCDIFINACDYDVEGEVIGYNTIKFACNADPLSEKVHRMKFSTLTEDAIVKAYNNLERTNKGMADAGITRHILDWYWGINLSRALSLAVRASGKYMTLSIGRVQGPTLKILSIREREIKAFKPEKYWQLELMLIKDSVRFNAIHVKDKFWNKGEAENVKKKCSNKAIVKKVEKKKFIQKPPVPFDLTTLQTEAYKHLNMDPRRTLEMAQDLYINAYISYPRTSSQQIPTDIDYRGILKKLGHIHEYSDSCKSILAKKRLEPNNGEKKDPAHPAIHPTGEIPKSLDSEAKKIYDLIVRRFMATFGDDAIRESVNVELDNNGEIFLASGKTTIEKGWHTLYGKFAKFEEIELPLLRENEIVDVEKILLHEKETQPPKRFTPASIIRIMEKKNLGTKATRSQIVDILFKRGYVVGKSIEVTNLGLGVVDTLSKYCPEVLSEKLTRKFEEEMDGIQEGKTSSNTVIDEGKATLTKILDEFKANEKNIGFSLINSIISASQQQRSLGNCLKCNGNLVLRTSKYDTQFIGCSNYPSCTFTISLPKGKLKKSGICDECGYAKITVLGKKPWSFCVNPECISKKKYQNNKSKEQLNNSEDRSSE